MFIVRRQDVKQASKPKGYVRFSVLGEPKGKGRPKFTTRGGYARAITPEQTVSYENLIMVEFRRQCGTRRFDDNVMIGMRVVAYYGVPKSASKKKRAAMLDGEIRPIKKPDNDNIVKVVEDALNDVAYKDDKNIVDCVVQKYYSEQPQIIVEMWNAEQSKLKISLTRLLTSILSGAKQ